MLSEYERAMAQPSAILMEPLSRMAEEKLPYDRWRPTEWAAILLWLTGFIVVKERSGLVTVALPARFEERQPGRLDGAVISQQQPIHPAAVGRVCRECNQRLPLNRHYWHVDSKGAGGYRTICKKCTNRAHRLRRLAVMQIKTPVRM